MKTMRTPQSATASAFLPGSQLLLSETGLKYRAGASCLAGVMLWIGVLASLMAAGANVVRPGIIWQLKKKKKEKKEKTEGPSPAHRGRDIPPIRGCCHPFQSSSKFKFVSSLRSEGQKME